MALTFPTSASMMDTASSPTPTPTSSRTQSQLFVGSTASTTQGGGNNGGGNNNGSGWFGSGGSSTSAYFQTVIISLVALAVLLIISVVSTPGPLHPLELGESSSCSPKRSPSWVLPVHRPFSTTAAVDSDSTHPPIGPSKTGQQGEAASSSPEVQVVQVPDDRGRNRKSWARSRRCGRSSWIRMRSGWLGLSVGRRRRWRGG